jgi:hypothetical protein
MLFADRGSHGDRRARPLLLPRTDARRRLEARAGVCYGTDPPF